MMEGDGRQALIFADAAAATAFARRGEEIPIHRDVRGVRSCFCLAAWAGGDRPEGLLFLNGSDAVETLAWTRLRLPADPQASLVLPSGLAEAERRRFIAMACDLFARARRRRSEIECGLEAAAAALPPRAPWRGGGPARILARASRYGPVIRHHVAAILGEFGRRGHETRFCIEERGWERLERIHWLAEVVAFRPDLIVSINANARRECAPGVRQVMWWQDMPALLRGGYGASDWSGQDLAYSLDVRSWSEGFAAVQAPISMMRQQNFCVDPEVYRPQPGIARAERSMVFVGNSYLAEPAIDLRHPAVRTAFVEMQSMIASGAVLIMEDLDRRFGPCGGPERSCRPSLLWCAALRTCVVRWMCRLAEEGWRIEVYGEGWERDGLARRFHHGCIAPGPDLARLYSRHRYGLVAQTEMVNHQRLAEVAGCGCVPVVWDCRGIAAPPRWEDGQMPFFRTEEQFRERISRRWTVDREAIMQAFSFGRFVDRIIADLQEGGERRSSRPGAAGIGLRLAGQAQ